MWKSRNDYSMDIMEFKGPWGWTLNGIVIGIAIFNVAGVAGTAYGPIWQFPVIFGGSGTPKCHFWGAKRFQTDPPRCEVQCSTLFNQCSTHLWSLGLPMANYGHIWPKRVILGGSGAPQCHFWGQKGSKLTLPDVKYNVQPCSTNVQPIWGR